MAELVVKYMPTDDLIPYANNPRRNDAAVDKVANSIKEFGFRVPIVVDADNVIVAGHTRLKAAKKLGLKTVPCVVADDLTEDQIKAYRLADNKVSELAEWDFELLDLELDDIELDMSQFGFEIEDTFDETDLDNTDEKTNVVASINCGSYSQYDAIKDRLQELADEIGGTLAVKMA